MIIEHITSTYWKKQKGTYEKNIKIVKWKYLQNIPL